MARQLITDKMLDAQLSTVTALLGDSTTFHRGSASAGVTNKLIFEKTNLWPDGMAGFTKRDAYNALRVMISALCAKEDA